ncbi:hypothetical protein [Mycoplasma procyoni]|uniref:hypothetical protein n=1 Tax=Mycoplasma procyoni TaxID=568784 RepID=UPI00197B0DB8|nr:hypothetical protein [Mycoplasma procyoni]MBN3534640.1 hypothetical protein [Mycoplasma procyoni]
MDKRQLKKQEFMDFIIFKIFSSKYRDYFVLENSESLFIKSENIQNSRTIAFRLPDDIDLNITILKEYYNKVIAILEEIFKNEKDISIEPNLNIFERKHRIIVNIKKIIDHKIIHNVKIDVIHDKNDYKIERESFQYQKQMILIQTYNIEKYIANKILSLRKQKTSNENAVHWLDNYKTENEEAKIIDLWWMMTHFIYNPSELKRNLKIMWQNKSFAKDISLLEYLKYLLNLLKNDLFYKHIKDTITQNQNLRKLKEFDERTWEWFRISIDTILEEFK